MSANKILNKLIDELLEPYEDHDIDYLKIINTTMDEIVNILKTDKSCDIDYQLLSELLLKKILEIVDTNNTHVDELIEILNHLLLYRSRCDQKKLIAIKINHIHSSEIEKNKYTIIKENYLKEIYILQKNIDSRKDIIRLIHEISDPHHDRSALYDKNRREITEISKIIDNIRQKLIDLYEPMVNFYKINSINLDYYSYYIN